MKIKVFNDTKEDWLLHSGSALGINGECRIPAHQFVEFEGPDNSELFIKVWDAVKKPRRPSVVMVSFTDSEIDLSQQEQRKIAARKHPFASAKSALFKANWKSPLKMVKRPYVDKKTGLPRL